MSRPLLLLLIGAALTATVAAAEPDPRPGFVFVAGGSGVVIESGGLVLTCHHVIASVCAPHRPTLEVRLADGTPVAARLVACDPAGDLALLQLADDHPPLTVRPLAERLPPSGSPVWAVGNPFGLGDLDDQPSISTGVLSTGLVVRSEYPTCAVHDAAVNPGNSGGPLYDADGRLLGINGAIRSRTGFRINSGIGIAIAGPDIIALLPALRDSRTGFVNRTAPPEGLVLADGDTGPMVSAGAGGLQVGDIVDTVAGRPAVAAVTARMLFHTAAWRPGAVIQVGIRRQGASIICAVPTDRLPIPGTAWSGLELDDRESRVELAVAEDSPAGMAGVPDGAVLLSLDGTTITSRLDAIRQLDGKQPGDTLALAWRAADGSAGKATIVLGIAP